MMVPDGNGLQNKFLKTVQGEPFFKYSSLAWKSVKLLKNVAIQNSFRNCFLSSS